MSKSSGFSLAELWQSLNWMASCWARRKSFKLLAGGVKHRLLHVGNDNYISSLWDLRLNTRGSVWELPLLASKLYFNEFFFIQFHNLNLKESQRLCYCPCVEEEIKKISESCDLLRANLLFKANEGTGTQTCGSNFLKIFFLTNSCWLFSILLLNR